MFLKTFKIALMASTTWKGDKHMARQMHALYRPEMLRLAFDFVRGPRPVLKR